MCETNLWLSHDLVKRDGDGGDDSLPVPYAFVLCLAWFIRTLPDVANSFLYMEETQNKYIEFNSIRWQNLR